MIIFFTGVPGSRWSGVAKLLCQHQSVNNSDCNETRTYRDMHFGNYFGPAMEHGNLFEKMDGLSPADIMREIIAPYTDSKIDLTHFFIKGHIFAYHLDFIKSTFPDSKIMLVHRDNDVSLKWWIDAGGFNITYPDYSWYVDEQTMAEKIKIENQHIINFAKKNNTPLEPFTTEWIKTNFDWDMAVDDYFDGVSVALI